jgi:DNA-binding transcriptional LysR family regulator
VTLEQLRIFVHVAERLHMTRAAEALGLTQSAVSAAVAALEARYDVRLFDRVGRGLALTEAGRQLLPEATAVLLRARAAEQALADLAGLKRGVLTVAASQTVASYWLPAWLARFAEAYPGVEVRMIAGNTAEASRTVREGVADLGVVEGRVDDFTLLRRPVAEDRISLYAAPSHPLAGREVGDAELKAAGWAVREPGSGTRTHFEETMAARGVEIGELRLVLELPSNEAALTAAADGELVAAVSDMAAAPLVAAERVVRLAVDLAPRPFDILTHKERRLSAAAKAFVARLTPAS